MKHPSAPCSPDSQAPVSRGPGNQDADQRSPRVRRLLGPVPRSLMRASAVTLALIAAALLLGYILLPF